MSWLAWSFAGALIVALWLIVMVMTAFSGADCLSRQVCSVFGVMLLAWLAWGVAGALGVYPRLTWGLL